MPNRIAILAAGPSVSLFVDDGRYDCVVGVNRTVEQFACDWWCVRDWRTYRDVTPLRRPLVFAPFDMLARLRDAAPATAQRLTREVVVHHESVEFPLARSTSCGTPRWTHSSALAALGLAWHFDAQHVDVFGCDLHGDTDYAARERLRYTPDRWHRERLLFDRMVTVFEQAGRSVCRVLPGQAMRARKRSSSCEHG